MFSGSEQIAYCSETSSDHCQISKMECFEKVVDGFELFSIFAKRSILEAWQGCEYGSTPDTQSGEETNAIAGTVEVIQRQKY